MSFPKKKVLLFFSLSLFSLVFVSCTESQGTGSNPNLFPEQSKDSVTLNVRFPFRSSFFEHDGKSYVCLYDLVTYKKAKLYDEELNLIKSFSLDHFGDLGLLLQDMEMITPDSVLLVTDYSSGTLIAFNNETLNYKLVKLNSLFPFPKIKVPLEFYPSLLSGFSFKNGVAFDVKPSQPAIISFYPGLKGIDQLKIYDSITTLLPFYVTVSDPFGERPVIKNIPRSPALLKSFENAYNNELNFTFNNKNTFVNTSRYMDYFDIYDIESNKSFTKPITSEFTDISSPKRKWSDLRANPSLLEKQIFNDDLRNAGRVKNIFFDAVNNKYHVLLFYSKESSPIKDPEVSPFIWQVYDENFVLLGEKEQAPTDLIIGNAISTKKYIYFQYYNADTYDPSQVVLVRYNY